MDYEKLENQDPDDHVESTQPIYVVHVDRDEYGIRLGDWDISFFGCLYDILPNCVTVTLCPFLSVAQIAHRIGAAHFCTMLAIYSLLFLTQLISRILLTLATMHKREDEAFLALGMELFCDVLSVGIIWWLRGIIRDRYKIQRECPGEDVVVALFCPLCTIAQMATHVQSYRPGSCNCCFPRDTLPPYPY